MSILVVASPCDAGRHRGFHERFALRDDFYGAPDTAAVGAALVLHAISVGPSLVLGLFFAARRAQHGGHAAPCRSGRAARRRP